MNSLFFLRSQLIAPYTGADLSMFDRALLLQKKHNMTLRFRCAVPQDHIPGIKKLLENLNITLSPELTYHFKGVPVEIVPISNRNSESLRELAHNTEILFLDERDYELRLALKEQQSKILHFLSENSYFQAENNAPLTEHAPFFNQPHTVLVATRFLQNAYERVHHFSPEHFVEMIDIERFHSARKTPGDSILLMHPYSHKGVGLVYELAKKRSDLQFLIASGAGADYRDWKARLQSCKNITLGQFSTDVTDLYDASRLVLVPSLCEDNFPRVIQEASAMGRPVIAHDVGGIKENLGQSGILLPRPESFTDIRQKDIQALEMGIEQALNSYEQLSKMAFERSASYVRERDEALSRFVSTYLHKTS